MAVRYMVETYGVRKVTDVIGRLSQVTNLERAIQQATGISYAVLEQRIVEYLRTWQDPDREAVRQYAATLTDVLEKEDDISDRRSEALNMPFARGNPCTKVLVSDARACRTSSRANLRRPPCICSTTTHSHTWAV